MSTSKSPFESILKFLSGMGLATTLLLLLGFQTWLATLEMVDAGLLATLRKYFHWTSWYTLGEMPVPFLERHLVVPMPGGYWVCALLLVNMTLGGLIRIRKSPRTVGVILAHFGIIFMVAAGGVAQLYEKRGVMFLFEGEEADYAVSLTKPNLEVLEIEGGEATGEVHLAGDEKLRGLESRDRRLIRFPALPFDLEITGWLTNTVVVPEGSGTSNPAIDGWTLRELPVETEGELNASGCYARVVFEDGTRGNPFILAVPPPSSGMESFAPQMIEAGGGTYAVRLVKQTIPVPYRIKLVDAVAEYYPNSMRPKSFMSDIERIEGESVPVEISMNEPMRRGGFTFFQRTMSSGPQSGNGPEFSGFEVVSNPADKWPEWSLWVVTAGLGIHFISMLIRSVSRVTRTPKSP